jgi:uncharacterized metal-binding protein YceD (DUF177 family)
VIPFKGLGLGTHLFEFEIDDRFFECFEYSEVKEGKVSLSLKLEKEDRMLTLTFSFHGFLRALCDRCLEPVDFPVDAVEQLFIKFGTEAKEEDDNVLVIPETEYKLELGHPVYEMLSLILPFRKVHPDDGNGNSTCNPEMLGMLSKHMAHQTDDSAWDALKKLKNNN